MSPGALTISGNFEQTSAGLLDIELSNRLSFDQLGVEGGAMLGGTLALSCYGNCTFTVGDSLQLLFAAGGVTGSFANITWGSFAPNTFDVVYGANEVRLLALT